MESSRQRQHLQKRPLAACWRCWSLVWSLSAPCGNWWLQAYVGKRTDLFLAQAMGPFIRWDSPQAIRFLCFAASRQACKCSSRRNVLLLGFGIWKHMFAFAKRYPVSILLPGTVRKAECGWRKSEEEAEEEKKNNKGYLQHTLSFVAQLCQGFCWWHRCRIWWVTVALPVKY